MNLHTLQLTAKQAEIAEWILGTPIFADSETPEELAHSHGETLEFCAELRAAADACKLDGLTLTVANNVYLIELMVGDAERYGDLAHSEGEDEDISKGMSHRNAKLKANAAAASAESLAEKLQALLPAQSEQSFK